MINKKLKKVTCNSDIGLDSLDCKCEMVCILQSIKFQMSFVLNYFDSRCCYCYDSYYFLHLYDYYCCLTYFRYCYYYFQHHLHCYINESMIKQQKPKLSLAKDEKCFLNQFHPGIDQLTLVKLVSLCIDVHFLRNCEEKIYWIYSMV